jgi:hypothetical protein
VEIEVSLIAWPVVFSVVDWQPLNVPIHTSATLDRARPTHLVMEHISYSSSVNIGYIAEKPS